MSVARFVIMRMKERLKEKVVMHRGIGVGMDVEPITTRGIKNMVKRFPRPKMRGEHSCFPHHRYY